MGHSGGFEPVKYLIIFLLPVIGGVAKHTVFAGSGPIWPWLILSCLVAAFWDWKAALAVGAGVAASQWVERGFEDPEIVQCGLYTVIALFLFKLDRLIAAMFIALTSVACGFAGLGIMEWLPAVIMTEFFIVFALIGMTHGGLSPIGMGRSPGGVWAGWPSVSRGGWLSARAVLKARARLASEAAKKYRTLGR